MGESVSTDKSKAESFLGSATEGSTTRTTDPNPTEYPFLPGESWEDFQKAVEAEFELSRQISEAVVLMREHRRRREAVEDKP